MNSAPRPRARMRARVVFPVPGGPPEDERGEGAPGLDATQQPVGSGQVLLTHHLFEDAGA